PEPRLLLGVGRLRLLHARDVTLPEPIVADRRGGRDDRPRDVGMQTLLVSKMRAHEPLRLRAYVVGPRVKAQHPDGPRALLANVRVLALGRPPARGVQARPEEILDHAGEGP